MPGDGLAQELLGFDLGDEEDVGKAALDMGEVEPEQRLALAVEIAVAGGQAAGDQRLGQAALVEKFERPRLNADGARGRRRLRGLLDQSDD